MKVADVSRTLAVGVVVFLLLSALPAAAQQDNVFRHTYTDKVITLDPAATHTHMDWEIILQVYEPLIQYKGSSLTELEPILATAVPTLDNGLISQDGLTYTFPIRRGVLFHDNTELTAEDVAYSFNRTMTMKIPQSKAQQYLLPHIKSVEAVDKYTVKFTLNKVYPGFLIALADPCATIVNKRYVEAHGGVAAEKENEWMRWHTCGTGPFILQEVVGGGERIILARNARYWGKKPSLDKIETVLVPDAATEILMLRRGEVDSIEVESDQLKNLQGIPGVVVRTGMPAIRSHNIEFQTNIDTSKMDRANTIPSDFFADVNVRKGFAYAFPYDDYMRVYRPGDSRYAGPIPNGILGNTSNTPMYTYDPAKAAEYFKKTPWWGKGFTVTMYTLPDWGTWPQAILMLSESLKKINPRFDVQMRAVEWATMVQMNTERSIPIQMAALRGATADPDSFVMNRMYRGGWNTMGLFDAEADRLIEEGARTLDVKARAKIYEKLQQKAYDTAYMLWISQDSGFMVHRDRVQGIEWHPIFQSWLSWRNISLKK